MEYSSSSAVAFEVPPPERGRLLKGVTAIDVPNPSFISTEKNNNHHVYDFIGRDR